MAQTIDSALARSLGLKDVRGALVSNVTGGSPAERAGVRRGDVILSVDGHAVADSNALRNRIASTQPGTRVALTIVRDGREQTLSATLGELAGARGVPVDGEEEAPGRGAFGLSVEPLTAERARQLGVRAERGLFVGAVTAGSAAERAGLRAGDVIETVDGRAVSSAAELRQALDATPDRPALVLVHREDQTLFLTVSR